MNDKVIIGFLGSKLDQTPARGDRWAAWRPTVAVCQHDDFLVRRLELLYDPRREDLLQTVLTDIASVSPETEVRPYALGLNDPWDFEEVYAALHQFTQKYEFDPDREDYLAHITTGTHVAQICMFLLTESRHLPGALLQTSPPRRRGKQDARGTYRVIDLDLSRYDELASRFDLEQQEGRSYLKSGIATRNVQFNQLIEQIERVSLATTAPVLITGPTGAGKSQLAKRIFEWKRQRQQISGPFVAVNCATIRGEQAMSTLFGHTKGAFTGAVDQRAGLLRSADQGILFLDEIGELGSDEQAMLLRAIEEKSFLPVGSDVPVTSDFQLLAGTNRDLAAEIIAGRFREDLLARINIWPFRLPGLAERREDIEPNIDYELRQFTAATGHKVTMSTEARQRFLEFALTPSSTWNANFRDLNAAIIRMSTLSQGGRITVAIVGDEIERLRTSWVRTGQTANDDRILESILGEAETEQLDRFDRAQLVDVIQVCRQSKSLSAAGRTLFQVSRKAKQKPNDADRLRKYLAKLGLEWKDLQETGS